MSRRIYHHASLAPARRVPCPEEATLARAQPAGSLWARGEGFPHLGRTGSLGADRGGHTYQLHQGSLRCETPRAGCGQLRLTWHRRASRLLGCVTPRGACAGSGPQCPAPRCRQHHAGRAAEVGWAPGPRLQLLQAALQLLLVPRAPGDSGEQAGWWEPGLQAPRGSEPAPPGGSRPGRAGGGWGWTRAGY